MLDGAFVSHILLWVIGGVSAVTAVLVAGALFTLGRQSSYKK
ncbi:hypothetical protein N8K70_06670 [Microbacterium betulae]|uniref:Uncharacterized protein n=1 Tax=Microbacterium betulae TaxID=2981139 RepID=A0AA97I8B9_9MICO|nr:hypothetical protein [Microbacterium sp. AB]WOF24345.1 hypothetical protein N8K70_06670 [Microbacterium sp. AB]